jgi:hypothetical protein
VVDKVGNVDQLVDLGAGTKLLGKLMTAMSYNDAILFAGEDTLLRHCVDPARD